MIVNISFQQKEIIKYDVKTNKMNVFQMCSNACEKVTTFIDCPKCKKHDLIEYVPNYPGIDLQCL